MQDDKRKFRRLQVNLSAVLEVVESPTGPIPVKVADVSFGGLGLWAAIAIPSGTQVSLIWEHPPFEPSGSVVYEGRIKNMRQKGSLSGQFFLNMAFENIDSRLVQKMLDWAQMQSFMQARSRARATSNTHSKPRLAY